MIESIYAETKDSMGKSIDSLKIELCMAKDDSWMLNLTFFENLMFFENSTFF